MVKNSTIHLKIETTIKNKYKQEAEKLHMSLAELVRQKLRQPHILIRLEWLLERLTRFRKSPHVNAESKPTSQEQENRGLENGRLIATE